MTGVETITMERYDAKRKYREYREHCRSKHTPEDRGVMLGYRALSEGKAVIDLYDVFRKCPADEKGLPKLAVGRAHWTVCWYDRTYPAHQAEFTGQRQVAWNAGSNTKLRIAIPGRVMNPACSANVPGPDGKDRRLREGPGRAVVPIIPANIRPKAKLDRYHILWEAEWEVVPKDPLLLRHLHGSLYAVLAQWDLTPLERAVLSHRL